MHYLVLIYGVEPPAPPPPSEAAAYMKPWLDYTNALKTAGVYVGGNALQSVASATTISRAKGAAEPVFTDGPFADTKEQLGGYYLLDCKNLDDALAWASKCPGVNNGKVEVRPVLELPNM
jgi:hypothetical protein